MPSQAITQQEPTWAHPVLGTALTVLAGISFQITCMLLPLVGPAGAVTPHAGKNYVTFLTALLVSLMLALAATTSKMARREVDGSPLPLFSIALSSLSALLLLAFLLGLLII